MLSVNARLIILFNYPLNSLVNINLTTGLLGAFWGKVVCVVKFLLGT